MKNSTPVAPAARNVCYSISHADQIERERERSNTLVCVFVCVGIYRYLRVSCYPCFFLFLIDLMIIHLMNSIDPHGEDGETVILAPFVCFLLSVFCFFRRQQR